MLAVKQDSVPEAVVKYLKIVQPTNVGPQEQLFNHGWIIGSETSISSQVQADISALLAPQKPGNKQ